MKDRFAVTARVAIGLIFVVSGFLKAVDPPQDFAAIIEAYYLLPKDWILPMAKLLPWAQLFCGVFLVTGYLTRVVAAAVAGMLSVFIYALLSAIYRGIPLESCGCFGSVHLSPPVTVALDIVLLGLTIFIYRLGAGALSLDAWIDAGAPD